MRCSAWFEIENRDFGYYDLDFFFVNCDLEAGHDGPHSETRIQRAWTTNGHPVVWSIVWKDDTNGEG